MAAQPVEWALVIYYGSSAHRATYGRLNNDTKYTKDYIQLSKKADFLKAMSQLFPVAGGAGSVPLTYRWHKGTASGAFVLKSADRPHLKWETNRAPQAWKMTPAPTDATPETIPGDPTHKDFDAAEKELALLARRGAGQPYLLAIKLRDETRTLHLRAYLAKPRKAYAWADLRLAPPEIQALAAKTSQRPAFAWSLFQSGGAVQTKNMESALSGLIEAKDLASAINELETETGRAIASYLRSPGYGLFFDPTRNHDAWLQPSPVPKQIARSVDRYLKLLEARFPVGVQEDAAAEMIEGDPAEVEAFREQIDKKNYDVPDATATVKTRGSAQKAFAEAVKRNYGYRCAISGIVSKDFLVAAHIVPWSADQKIRLDPSNGICLSLLVDRAFEKGYLLVENDFTIRVNWDMVNEDQALRAQLSAYDGQTLRLPKKEVPLPEYLERRRALVALPKVGAAHRRRSRKGK
jgi:hypothetical protein